MLPWTRHSEELGCLCAQPNCGSRPGFRHWSLKEVLRFVELRLKTMDVRIRNMFGSAGS